MWLATPFGKSEAWFLPGKGTSPARKPVVLFFHGNGELIDFLPAQVEGFRALGVAVFLIEYPGYGRSEGAPSEASITAAAVAAYDTVIKRDDVDPARVVAFGRSLGCGPACALSLQRPLAALLLQSPFTSTRSFARRFFLPGFLIRDVYDNRKALAAFPGPVLILHGRDDDVIPFAQGKELSRVAPHARFVELACAHNDCPPDWREFWHLIGDFLRVERIVDHQE
jgi:pimeloyl-ACP methyl ester carboxylesterase